MLSDPRIGFGISLGVAAVSLLWLIGQLLDSGLLWPMLGYGMHAVTLLAIFALAASGPAAFLFLQYATVRADLLAGRNVIARWHIDPKLFRAFSKAEAARDLGEKRSALYLILVFMGLIFGAFALFDPEAAGGMLAIGGIVNLAILVAFWLGNRVARKHARLRSGEIIVGRRGLLVNGVLHVWGSFLTWFSGVSLHRGSHPALTISYRFLARYGPQQVTVVLPVSAGQLNLALEVRRQLGGNRPAPDG
jgi:hypothetical protein